MAEDTEDGTPLARINAVLADPNRYTAAKRFAVAGHEVTEFRSENPALAPFFMVDYASDILSSVRPTEQSVRTYAQLAELACEFKTPLVPPAKAPTKSTALNWSDFMDKDPMGIGLREGELHVIIAKQR